MLSQQSPSCTLLVTMGIVVQDVLSCWHGKISGVYLFIFCVYNIFPNGGRIEQIVPASVAAPGGTLGSQEDS